MATGYLIRETTSRISAYKGCSMTVYPVKKELQSEAVKTEEQEDTIQTCYQGHKNGERKQRKRVREIQNVRSIIQWLPGMD